MTRRREPSIRPGRIIVGQVRGARVVDPLAALNTGIGFHDGGASRDPHNSPVQPSRPRLRRIVRGLGGLGLLGLVDCCSPAGEQVQSVVGWASGFGAVGGEG